MEKNKAIAVFKGPVYGHFVLSVECQYFAQPGTLVLLDLTTLSPLWKNRQPALMISIARNCLSLWQIKDFIKFIWCSITGKCKLNVTFSSIMWCSHQSIGFKSFIKRLSVPEVDCPFLHYGGGVQWIGAPKTLERKLC